MYIEGLCLFSINTFLAFSILFYTLLSSVYIYVYFIHIHIYFYIYIYKISFILLYELDSIITQHLVLVS